MCLGLPMTIVETDGVSALCEFRGERRRVSILLLPDLPVGSKVLVHIDTAIRLLDEAEARLIAEAIEGLTAVLGGEDCDRFFADLIEREPQLPEHLRFDPAADLPNPILDVTRIAGGSGWSAADERQVSFETIPLRGRENA